MSKIGLIYQYFLGRHASGNELIDKGEVINNIKTVDWSKLKKLHVDTIYFLGLFENKGNIVVMNEEGVNLNSEHRLPSIFAISDHKKVKEVLGTETDWLKLVKIIQKQGLKVIVDFVPNHTGLNHPWINIHPNYYRYEDGKIIREFSGDVAKLNYDNAELRQEMILILECLASWGVDGVRCDMAHLVPNSFWKSAIADVKGKNTNFKFIAEAYSETAFDWSVVDGLIDSGFDAVYEEIFIRNIHNYLENNLDLEHVVNHINYVIKNKNPKRKIFYVMNHDDDLGVHAETHLRGLTSLIMCMPGNRLIFNGQALGNSKRLGHHFMDELNIDKDETLSNWPKWFVKLMNVISSKNISISKVEKQENDILCCETSVDNLMFYLNLGSKSLQAENVLTENKDVLWKLRTGNEFNSGDAMLALK